MQTSRRKNSVAIAAVHLNLQKKNAQNAKQKIRPTANSVETAEKNFSTFSWASLILPTIHDPKPLKLNYSNYLISNWIKFK